MSVQIWNIENNLCRCCHAEGNFDNLAMPQTYIDDVEIYIDMLKDCLNIEVLPIPGDLCIVTYKICKECIKKLRNASNFKKQVKRCENFLLEMFHKNRIKASNSKKKKVDTKTPIVIELSDDEETSQKDDHLKNDLNNVNNELNGEENPVNKDQKSSDDEISSNKQNQAEELKSDKVLKEVEPKNANQDVSKQITLKRGRLYLKPEDYKKVGDKFMCGHCDRTFLRFCSIHGHIKKKHCNVPVYKCSLCPEGFKSLPVFRAHKLQKHNIDDRYICDLCNRVLSTKWDLRNHINNIHKAGKKHTCDLCNFKTFSARAMRYHKADHEKAMVYLSKFFLKSSDYEKVGDKMKCSHCDKIYNKTVSLQLHVKKEHYKVPKYKCPVCQEGFVRADPFTAHKFQQHNIDDRFKCNACVAVFNSKVALKRHTDGFHMLGRKYKCDKCDYESFHSSQLKRHKLKHKALKDHHCKFCSKSFVRRSTLLYHERIHTGDKRKVCKVCSQAFVQKASLNYHMTKHHPGVDF